MSNDNSGKPIWTPTVIDGEGKKEEKQASSGPEPGGRRTWNIANLMEDSTTQTEFDIRYGDSPVKFKMIGNAADAFAVVSALRLSERVSRNAMRMAIDYAVNKGFDISKDPTMSAYTQEESSKFTMFLSWLVSVGNMFIAAGHRPWDGKAADVGVQEQDAPALSLVKPGKEDVNVGSDDNLN